MELRAPSSPVHLEDGKISFNTSQHHVTLVRNIQMLNTVSQKWLRKLGDTQRILKCWTVLFLYAGVKIEIF